MKINVIIKNLRERERERAKSIIRHYTIVIRYKVYGLPYKGLSISNSFMIALYDRVKKAKLN